MCSEDMNFFLHACGQMLYPLSSPQPYNFFLMRILKIISCRCYLMSTHVASDRFLMLLEFLCLLNTECERM